MYDSVTWAAIPLDAAIVAGYVDGAFKWPAVAWLRFPNAIKLRIVCFASTNDGDGLDMEWGDATPEECPGWLKTRMASIPGKVFWIYCETSRRQEVEDACLAQELHANDDNGEGGHYDLWVAEYGPPTRAHIPAGAAACQWADPARGSGGNYDISWCRPWWPRLI